jgi:GAF domain-containing protein
LAVVTLAGGDSSDADGDQPRAALVAPIVIQNVQVGDLQLHGLETDRTWTESELALIEAVIDQVAQTAENLRLIEETRERASRERLIGQVSDNLRRAPDMDTLLKVAVGELARVLKPARTFVHLEPKAESEDISENGSDNETTVSQKEADAVSDHPSVQTRAKSSASNGSEPQIKNKDNLDD